MKVMLTLRETSVTALPHHHPPLAVDSAATIGSLAPMTPDDTRIAEPDHGGGIDAAAARWGGTRADWLDLSTGINPRPYPIPPLPADAWTALPDRAAFAALETAARRFWAVPAATALIAAPGASALRCDGLAQFGRRAAHRRVDEGRLRLIFWSLLSRMARLATRYASGFLTGRIRRSGRRRPRFAIC